MITPCILSKNSGKTLFDTLSSLHSFPEVILLDTGSTDETLEVAKQFSNVRIYKAPFTSFGLLRNQAAQLASNDWILAIDSDEILSHGLIEELSSLSLDSPDALYEMPFHNFLNGKRIYGCGWHPDKHIRLYNRQFASFSEVCVHEGIHAQKKQVFSFQYPILHTPYSSHFDFLEKMQRYSDLFAEQYRGKKNSSFTKALLHGVWAFIRSYFWKRGLISGKEGFLISIYNANTAFYKYLKLAEINRDLK